MVFRWIMHLNSKVTTEMSLTVALVAYSLEIWYCHSWLQINFQWWWAQEGDWSVETSITLFSSKPKPLITAGVLLDYSYELGPYVIHNRGICLFLLFSYFFYQYLLNFAHSGTISPLVNTKGWDDDLSNSIIPWLYRSFEVHKGKTRTVESARKAFYYRRSISLQLRIFNPVM